MCQHTSDIMYSYNLSEKIVFCYFTALCDPPCDRGVCVEPNMCFCHGGVRARHCPHTGY